jgi:hypothetical protein
MFLDRTVRNPFPEVLEGPAATHGLPTRSAHMAPTATIPFPRKAP